MASDMYFVTRDAEAIAKFLSRLTSHKLRLELHRLGTGEFPRPIGKDAKWPAYEAAGRIVRTLGLEPVHSVDGLATVLSAALAWLNSPERYTEAAA